MTLLAWTVTLAVFAVLMVADLALTPNTVGLRAAAISSALWIAASLAFGGALWLWRGPAPAGQYFAGYLLEKALSVDNVFVFVMLFASLQVPQALQRRVLPAWLATPFVVALVAVEATDLVFALDSIPAVFGVTRDLFVVFTFNAFAVLGLRALYFLLAGSVDRFAYLKQGIAVLLVFIGVKMLISPLVHLPVWVSLAAIVVIVGGAVAASLCRRPAAGAEPGRAPERRRAVRT